MSRLHRLLPVLAVIGVLLVGLPFALAEGGPEEASEPVHAGLASNGSSHPPIVAPSTLVLLGLGLVGLAICQARLKQER